MEDTVKSFQNVGMQVTPEQLWHPAKTMVHYLRSIQFDGLIYIIATANFKAHLTEAGFQLIDGVSKYPYKILLFFSSNRIAIAAPRPHRG